MDAWYASDIICHFLKSKTKEPSKLLSSSGIRGSKFISVNNFSNQWLASSENRHILNFGVMAEKKRKKNNSKPTGVLQALGTN